MKREQNKIRKERKKRMWEKNKEKRTILKKRVNEERERKNEWMKERKKERKRVRKKEIIIILNFMQNNT